jgi:hypothetical protein
MLLIDKASKSSVTRKLFLLACDMLSWALYMTIFGYPSSNRHRRMHRLLCHAPSRISFSAKHSSFRRPRKSDVLLRCYWASMLSWSGFSARRTAIIWMTTNGACSSSYPARAYLKSLDKC